MKTLITVAMGLAIAFLMTGCSTKVAYTQEYTDGALKSNLNKVDQRVIIQKHEDRIIGKRPYLSFQGGAMTNEVNVSQLGDEITKDFFEQYFNEVYFGYNGSDDFFVDFVINDFTFTNDEVGAGTRINLDLYVSIDYKGKRLLTKNYEYSYYTGRLIIVIGADLIKGPKEQRVEAFNKSIIHAYEDLIKPDILEALRKRK